MTRGTLARTCAVLLLAFSPSGSGVASAQSAPPTGLELAGLPAVNFDADEGFGYGAFAELYDYGQGGLEPYVWTAQPEVFFATRGRRDFTLFLDAPHLLPAGWRIDAFLGVERRLAAPYYGIGNETVNDPALDDSDGPDPRYYRFGRTRRSALVNLQRDLGDTPLRALLGVGVVNTRIDPFPGDRGTTLYALDSGDPERTYWTNYVRAGLVWDSRDRESGPRRGVWTELLVQRVDEGFGADVGFTRWTFSDRRYLSLVDGLVLAHRWLLQGVHGDAPIYQLQRVQTSFKLREGLGGSKTVRGLLRNRYTGRGILIWNTELRWRVADFEMIGRPFHAVLVGFLDQGRVWAGDVRFDELLTDLHRGYGGGVRVGMGENFVGGADVATSAETGLQLYVGLGYLY